METILVTGVGGFVGKHLSSELITNDYSVVGIDRQRQISTTNANHLSVDLTNGSALRAVDFSAIDAVIHLAGLAAVGPSFDHPLDYIKTNMGIEVNLFEEAMRQKSYPRFLIISSGGLYGQAELPLTERSIVLPSSPYAVSKLGQEQLAAYYATRGFECVVARPFNHIGPGQKTGFIVPDLAEQILAVKQKGGKEISVGNLKAKRDYTDVRDIARAYRLLLEKGKPGEIYNVCSGKALSGYDILNGLMDAAGVSLKPVLDSSKLRPNDTPEIYGSFDKLKQDTGWQPEISIEQTLRDVIQSM